ncbi:protein kinase domain-containing protein [Flavonifractor sp. An112]|uniref:protein kinase domain-containing protein n=1 Tax=Flavonifractor sp. An112 TaxID=1965544 RepID=UPI001302401F|nr:protein kinase [Flavonifractor sp. An112]
MSVRMQDLSGEIITSVEGTKYKLGELAGYGAQGVVYQAENSSKMIKLYYPTGSDIVDSEILERLSFIKNVKVPPNFVAIHELIEAPYVGYVMDRVVDHRPLNTYLIPDKNLSFAEWYNQGFGLRERIFLGYLIAKAFGALERSNLSYCDISGNNILVKIGKGASIKMIDVDNIYVAGKGNAAVLGTPRYIAPEVISRQKNPDVLSDNYSLAVILFELLRVGHPYISDEVLDGSPEDEEAALAGKVTYVTDENSTNMLPADIVLTVKLKELFRKCFVDGKRNRMARPSAQEFEFALLEASNKVIKCPSCGAWHYPRKANRVYSGCPWCDAPSKPKARLNFYDVLSEGSDYRKGTPLDGSTKGKLVNSYILREGKNQIKSLYVLRADDPSKAIRAADNYLTIAKDSKGYWAYNEFSKNNIVVKKYQTGEYHRIGIKKAILLDNGDAIYFEMNVTIEVGGKQYSFIRMARFMEET